jgi:phosphoribosylformylglycinamidine synthase
MIGLIYDHSLYGTQCFKKEGDIIVLIGETKEEVGGSEYLKVIHNLEKGLPPMIDLGREKIVHDTCLEAIRAGIIRSAHDCSEGGLGVTLAECCISNKERRFGATIYLESPMRKDALLFGESQSRIIVSLDENNLPLLQRIADSKGSPLKLLGRVGNNKLTININGDVIIGLEIERIAERWGDRFEAFLKK